MKTVIKLAVMLYFWQKFDLTLYLNSFKGEGRGAGGRKKWSREIFSGHT